MEVSSTRIQELIEQPQESLAVELKAWIDPELPKDIAKIVKTSLAMRNHDGGYMVIGIDDKTLEPIFDDAPDNVREMFHIDVIQRMISKYSSEIFEVTVEFPERNGQEFPVIVIPTGIRTPVVAKSDLNNPDPKRNPLIHADTVYVRSLSSNNIASTTQAKSADWSRLMEVCFDNREADIGRFIRRHLGSINPEQLSTLGSAIIGNFQPEMSNEDLLKEYLQESEQRYEKVLKKQDIDPSQEDGTWEVGLILKGEIPSHSANQDFLNLLSSSNPRYSGWPVWIDSRRFSEEDHPHVFDGVLEAFLIDYIEFIRFDPQGRFFLRRPLREDMKLDERSPEPLTTLYFNVAILRTAEAMAVGLEFAKAMGCVLEETTLAFAFKWTKLEGRNLSSTNNPLFHLRQYPPAHQDEIITFVDIPLDTPLSALSQYVNQAVQSLFELFGGFSIDQDSVDSITQKLIERRY